MKKVDIYKYKKNKTERRPGGKNKIRVTCYDVFCSLGYPNFFYVSKNSSFAQCPGCFSYNNNFLIKKIGLLTKRIKFDFIKKYMRVLKMCALKNTSNSKQIPLLEKFTRMKVKRMLFGFQSGRGHYQSLERKLFDFFINEIWSDDDDIELRD